MYSESWPTGARERRECSVVAFVGVSLAQNMKSRHAREASRNRVTHCVLHGVRVLSVVHGTPPGSWCTKICHTSKSFGCFSCTLRSLQFFLAPGPAAKREALWGWGLGCFDIGIINSSFFIAQGSCADGHYQLTDGR